MGVPIALGSHQEFAFTVFQRVEEGESSGLMQLGEKIGDRGKSQAYVPALRLR